jgi:hypothetical protein
MVTAHFDSSLGAVTLTDAYGLTVLIDRQDNVDDFRYGLPLDRICDFEEGFSVVVSDPGYFEGVEFTPGKNDPDCAALSRNGQNIRYMNEVLAIVPSAEDALLAFLRLRILMGKADLEIEGISEGALGKEWAKACRNPDLNLTSQMLSSMGYQIGPMPYSAGEVRLVLDARMAVDITSLRTDEALEVELNGGTGEAIRVGKSPWAQLMYCNPEAATAVLVAEEMARLGIADRPSFQVEPVGEAKVYFLSLHDRVDGLTRQTEYAFLVAMKGMPTFASGGTFLDDPAKGDGGLRDAVIDHLGQVTPEMVGMSELRAADTADLEAFFLASGEMYLGDIASPAAWKAWDDRSVLLNQVGLEMMAPEN